MRNDKGKARDLEAIREAKRYWFVCKECGRMTIDEERILKEAGYCDECLGEQIRRNYKPN